MTLSPWGIIVKKNNFRISAHPDHFTLLNSPREEVFEASIKDLEYHHNIFESMGLDKRAKLVLHIGGRYKSKEVSVQRFMEKFSSLPEHLKERIILENDDKTYNTMDVLEICKKVNVPMVLDIHHHWCNNKGDIITLLEPIFNTWNKEGLPPKIHLSSPKNEKNYRSHADNIKTEFFIEFLNKAKEINRDFDVMIEAKNKDLALFNLMKDLKKTKDIRIINQAEIEY